MSRATTLFNFLLFCNRREFTQIGYELGEVIKYRKYRKQGITNERVINQSFSDFDKSFKVALFASTSTS